MSQSRMPRLPLPQAYLDPAFMVCVLEATSTPELIANFDRLYGADLSKRGAPLARMIDEATGKAADDMKAFFEFVHFSLYMTLEDEAIDDLRKRALGIDSPEGVETQSGSTAKPPEPDPAGVAPDKSVQTPPLVK